MHSDSPHNHEYNYWTESEVSKKHSTSSEKTLLVIITLLSIFVITILGIFIYHSVILRQKTAHSPIRNDEVSPTPINSISNWKTFTNPYYNYSLKYPNDWHLVQYDKDGKPYEIVSSTDLNPDKHVIITPIAIDPASDIPIEISVRVWNAESYKSVNEWLNSEYHLDIITPIPDISVRRRTRHIAGHEWEETNWFPGWAGVHRMVLVNGHVYHLSMIPYEYNPLLMDSDITQDSFNYFDAIQSSFQVLD